MKYVVYQNSAPVGFMDQPANSNVPAGSVAIPDAVYRQWVSAPGGIRSMTYDAAAGTLSLVAPTPPSKAALVTYAEALRRQVADGGFTLNIAAQGQPAQNVRVGTTNADLTNYTGLYLLAAQAQAQNQSYTSNWVNEDGSVSQITAAQIQSISSGAAAFVQSTYTALGQIVAQINSGSVASFAAVKGFAWPSNA